MLVDEPPENGFGFAVKLLAHTGKAMMTFAGHFHGEALNCPFVDERFHFFTSGQSWHSWKNSHEPQANEGAGTKSSRSTPST